MLLGRIVYYVFKFVIWILARVDARGMENIPAQGGAILAINHLSWVDAPLVYTHIKRPDATGLAADKYKKYPFMRLVINMIGGIWLDRENPGAQTIRDAVAHLQGGGLLGIAPEGTRSTTGQLISAKLGVAYLATKAGVPIVPVAQWGTETAFRKLLRLQRPRLYLRFGEPFMLPPLDRKNRDADLQRNADEIMCRIAAMLPPEYHGAYADHPRLRELQAESSPEPL